MFPARVWREFPQRYRLEAVKNKDTGEIYFPPRVIGKNGKKFEAELYVLPDEGTIYTYTEIQVPPSQFKDEAPYVVAIIELTDGTKVTCQLTDYHKEWLAIGKKVRLEFRRVQTDDHHGVLSYGYKAVPAE
jgi:uncharacterized OB-fold protein